MIAFSHSSAPSKTRVPGASTPSTFAGLENGRVVAAVVVVFGVLEYLRRAQQPDAGGSPVDLVLRDRVLQACGAGWVLATLWSLGWA